MTGRPAALAAALLVAACEAEPPRTVGWTMVLAEGSTAESAVVVAVQIASTPCVEPCAPDQPCSRFVATLPLDGDGSAFVPEGAEPLPHLPRGPYAFRATLLDDQCHVVARGCADVEVPTEILVTLESPEAIVCACPPDECSSGFCASEGRSMCACLPPPTETGCRNDIDDDCDGTVDCRDPDCNLMSCGPGVVCRDERCVPENERGRCNNGADDDRDGDEDCADTADCPDYMFCAPNHMCCDRRCVDITTNNNCGMCGLHCDTGADCAPRLGSGRYVCRGCNANADCPVGWVCMAGDCECQDDEDCCRGDPQCNDLWWCTTERDNRHCTRR